MISKTSVIKKVVHQKNKQFYLTYSLVAKDDFRYGIEVTCQQHSTRETERIWTGSNYRESLRLLYLFAKETVFPIALKETWENL